MKDSEYPHLDKWLTDTNPSNLIIVQPSHNKINLLCEAELRGTNPVEIRKRTNRISASGNPIAEDFIFSPRTLPLMGALGKTTATTPSSAPLIQ